MSWDDGSHAKVNKVQITYDDDIIYSIQVTYDGTPSVQSQRRGSIGPKSAEFTLKSNEYITALSAYRGNTLSTQEFITALTFTTNEGSFGPYGNKSGFQISAPGATGKQIAGFLGTSGNALNSLNVHYAPIPGPEKLAAQGGTGGTAWDDGSDHAGVTKIHVRPGEHGIQFVKFDYVKDGQPKLGTLHGEEGKGITKEIVINHPDEYIVAVEGWASGSTIMGIQFETNLNTRADLIGFEGPGTEYKKFNLQVQDKKIIGFHGSIASAHLNSIGAYFVPKSPTSPPSVPVKKLEAKGGDKEDVWDDSSHDNVKKVYVGQAQDGIGAVKFEYFNGSQVIIGNEHGKPTLLGFDEFELESDEYITSVEGTYDKILGAGSGIVTMLIFKTNKNNTAGPFGLEGSTHFEFKEEGYKITGFHGRAGETINAIGAYLAPVGTIPLTPARPL